MFICSSRALHKKIKMTSLHEVQISKARKIAGYSISVIPSLTIFMAGLMKIIGAAQVQANMAKITNFEDKTMMIGVLELLLVTLYWIPRTMNLGFWILASYGGGIIVAEIVAGGMPIPGIAVTSLFYIGTLLRKPSLSGLNI